LLNCFAAVILFIGWLKPTYRVFQGFIFNHGKVVRWAKWGIRSTKIELEKILIRVTNIGIGCLSEQGVEGKALQSGVIILLWYDSLIVHIFAYYNHKNNCLNRLVKALPEVEGYCNRFVIIVNYFNNFKSKNGD